MEEKDRLIRIVRQVKAMYLNGDFERIIKECNKGRPTSHDLAFMKVSNKLIEMNWEGYFNVLAFIDEDLVLSESDKAWGQAAAKKYTESL